MTFLAHDIYQASDHEKLTAQPTDNADNPPCLFVVLKLMWSILFCNRWTYQTEKELDGRSHWGRITTYSGGGFTMLLEARREKTKALIDKLKVSCKKMLCMLVNVQWTTKHRLEVTKWQTKSISLSFELSGRSRPTDTGPGFLKKNFSASPGAQNKVRWGGGAGSTAGTNPCNATLPLVHLLNSTEILVLAPHLCTSIWVYVMIGLLRKAIVNFLIRMKGNLKLTCSNSLSPGGGGGSTEQGSWCCFADVTNWC